MLRRTVVWIVCCSWMAAAWASAETPAATGGHEHEGTWEEFGPVDEPSVEATLFLGLLRSDSLDTVSQGAKIDFDEDLDLGVIVSIPTSYEGFWAELIYSHHEMEVTADRPGQPLLAVVDQELLHVGGLWELGDGPSRGFATASVGVVEIDPEGGFYNAETMPSVGLGGGGRFRVGRRVGFRVEGRILGHVGDNQMLCNRGAGCLGQVSSSLMVQFLGSVGISVRF